MHCTWESQQTAAMQTSLELTGPINTTPLAADSSSSPTSSISKRGKGREMISDACLVPCCSAGRDEFLQKLDDQCGEGCSHEVMCGIERCNGYKICIFLILAGGIGIFLLPLYMLFSVLYDGHSCGHDCCYDNPTCCVSFCR